MPARLRERRGGERPTPLHPTGRHRTVHHPGSGSTPEASHQGHATRVAAPTAIPRPKMIPASIRLLPPSPEAGIRPPTVIAMSQRLPGDRPRGLHLQPTDGLYPRARVLHEGDGGEERSEHRPDHPCRWDSQPRLTTLLRRRSHVRGPRRLAVPGRGPPAAGSRTHPHVATAMRPRVSPKTPGEAAGDRWCATRPTR